MKIFACLLLLVVVLFACTKNSAENSKTKNEIEVMVYATHANDTTKIVSTDPAHVQLK